VGRWCGLGLFIGLLLLAQVAAAATDAAKGLKVDLARARMAPITGDIPHLSRLEIRKAVSQALSEDHWQKKWEAWDLALSQGVLPCGWDGATYYEMMAIKEGTVYTFKTLNVNAAIVAAVDQVRDMPPHNLSGAGQIVGLWDGGSARRTHQEFGKRIRVWDGSSPADHATHVAGTIAAGGTKAAALGMAPDVRIASFEFNEDRAEVALLAMSMPDESNMIQVSNHSYGLVAGWDYHSGLPIWYGTWGERESDMFGQYDEYARNWDALCYAAPYYLPFKAAGNDRTDSVPMPGMWFVYFTEDDGFWIKDYELNSDPLPDAWDKGGFDTLPSDSVSKNIVTVGAVDLPDAAEGRDLEAVTVASFSGWGPTDDGRVKPDVVAQGVDLYSSMAGTDHSYGVGSGTSMASPVACGAAALLPECYGRLFSGKVMRSATIKALVIHAADDLGRPGPDYTYGWGLVNARKAVEHIEAHHDTPDAHKIVEDVVDLSTVQRSYQVTCDAGSPVAVTMVWTDPPGAEIDGLDVRTPNLVNDLDVRVIGPDGTVYEPFVLDVSQPTEPAGVGDNIRDNVEQVRVDEIPASGTYEVRVTYKGTLTDQRQEFSLLISGQSAAAAD
jgi:subtilase family protein